MGEETRVSSSTQSVIVESRILLHSHVCVFLWSLCGGGGGGGGGGVDIR